MYKCEYDGKCLACDFYGRCTFREKTIFNKTELPKYENTLWGRCIHKNSKHCHNCKLYRDCVVERGLPYREFELSNVIYNKFPNSDYDEIVFYKETFRHLVDSENLTNEDVDRKRLLRLGDDGIYEPIDDDFSIAALQRSIRNATKRSLDTFYGYAQSNDWEHFGTLTFSPEAVDRYDIDATKSLYSEFQRWCKRKSPDMKLLAVPEWHKKEVNGKRALHLHFLASNIRFNLVSAQNPETGAYLYGNFGEPLFNIKDWSYGFSSLAIIPPENNYARVTHYMKKYITKSMNIGYNAKRFYHTRNLLFKNKHIFLYDSQDELEQDASAMGLVKVKEDERRIVYRKILNDKEIENE